MRFASSPGLCQVCVALVLVTSVVAAGASPAGSSNAPYPLDNHPDVAIQSPSPMDASVFERSDLLGNLLPLNPKSPDAPAAAGAPPPATSSPVAGAPAAAVPPPPASPSDPNHAKAANGGVLPGLLNGVLGTPQPSSATLLSTPTAVHKAAPTSAADTNGDGVPDNQGPASSGTHSDKNNDADSNSNGLPPEIIALLVLVGLAVVGAVAYSCYRVRAARLRRKTHQFDDEDILRGHAGAVGYSAGGGYGVYMEKQRNDLWSRNLDIFHRSR